MLYRKSLLHTYFMYSSLDLLIPLLFIVQPLNRVWLFVTPWNAARPASLSFTISQTFLKFMSIE